MSHLAPGSQETAPTPPVSGPAPVPPRLAPQPGVAAPDPDQQLPRRILTRAELLAPAWWVGAHGGAGESTLTQLLPTTRSANHAWPISPDAERFARVFLVARTSHHGLISAQTALRDWASGSVGVDLAGLVLIADAPGRLPKELRALQHLVEAAGPGSTWHLPWNNEWRLGRIYAERPERELQKLVDHLNTTKE